MATKCETQFYETLRKYKHSEKNPKWDDVTDLIGKWQKALDSVGVSRWDQVNIADVLNVDSALTGNSKKVSQLRTGLDAILEKHINLETKVQHRKFIANYRNESAVASVLSDMDAIARQRVADTEDVSAIDLVKALRDLLARPADNTKIGLTLEESQNSVFADHFNRLVVSKIYDEIPEAHITKLFNDRQFVDDLLAEMHRTQTDINAKKPKTSNTQAQRVAEILNDAIGQMNLRLTQLGRPTPFTTGNLIPNFNWQKIQAWLKSAGDNGETKFIEFFADKLDGANSLDIRVQIAEQVLGNLKTTKGFIDWESVVENVAANGKNTKLKERVRFKDGESWTAINDAFGERDFMTTIIGQFRYLSKQIAISQMFGADWMRNWQQIQKRIRESQSGNERIFQTKEWRRAQNTFDRLTASPKVPSDFGISTALTTGRSLEVATKLGSAVITALMDVPIVINVVTRMYGNSFMRNIDEVLSGFTNKEARRYAERLNIGVDGMMGSLQDRFMLHDDWHSMNVAQRKVSNISHFVMKISGLEAWTDMFRSGVTALFRKEMGELIGKQVLWENMDERLRGTLERFKITEGVWGTLNARMLDEKGKFDVLAIQDRATREAFLGWFKDAVETAIISPSLRDIEHTAWMTQGGSGTEEVVKTLMQFKQFPLSYTRKVIGRHIADTSQTKVQKLTSLAQLTAMGTLMGAVVTQTQQYASGKQPYALDSVDLWTRSFALASPFGIMTDMFMESGGDSLAHLLLGENPKFSDKAKTLLGPLFGDLATVSKHLLEIGGVAGNAALTEFGIVSPTYDTEEQLTKRMSKLTQWAIRQVPAQNLWQTKAIYQMLFADALQEMMDPQAYARQQRRILDEGQKRHGEEYFNPYGQFLQELK